MVSVEIGKSRMRSRALTAAANAFKLLGDQ